MVRFGYCLPIGSFVPEIIDSRIDSSSLLKQLKYYIPILIDNGYDFIELTVGSIYNLDEEGFIKLKEFIHEEGITVPVFSSFIPPSLHLTGSTVSMKQIDQYVTTVFERIHQLNGKFIIFGSGAARSINYGFERSTGIKQIKDFLSLCQEYASRYALTVAIENLNKTESNIFNTVEEAFNMVTDIKLTNIKVMADSYHMYRENEPFEKILELGNLLVHTHVAGHNRNYPGLDPDKRVDFEYFFKNLKKIEYQGGISVECTLGNFITESAESLKYLKKLWNTL